jgi:ATP-dependent DNA ligase
VVSKHRDAAYRLGEGRDWRKIKDVRAGRCMSKDEPIEEPVPRKI